MSDSYQAEIDALNNQIKELDPTEDADLIKTLQELVAVARTKKSSYDLKIKDVTEQIDKLKEGGA